MDKNIYEQLIPYEKILHNAYYSSYVRITDNTTKAELARLHKEQFGNDGNILGGCSRCVLSAVTKLAREYFKEKKLIEEKAKADVVGLEAEQITELVENKAVTKNTKKSSANKDNAIEK